MECLGGSQYIVVGMLLDVLKCMKKDKSLGSDQVCPRTQWKARKEIAGALTGIHKSLFATGGVKETLRLKKINPVIHPIR